MKAPTLLSALLAAACSLAAAGCDRNSDTAAALVPPPENAAPDLAASIRAQGRAAMRGIDRQSQLELRQSVSEHLARFDTDTRLALIADTESSGG